MNADGLPDAGTEKDIGLLHRSLARARAGLVSAAATPGHPGAVAYVSLSLPDDEDEDDDVPERRRMNEAEDGAPAMPDRTPEGIGPRPAAVDAALDRDDPDVGTEVIELVFASDDFDAVAARVERALGTDRFKVRQLACVAAGDLARTSGRLTPGIYAALRKEGLGGVADTAVRDVLTFVPFRQLSWWFRWTWIRLTVLEGIEGRRLRAAEAVRDAWSARSGRSGPPDHR
ncbi:hypothetical protein ABZ747_06170 [Kitasatospora cineracea]|uniref:hypothetical protein n=1 Tax=Kitasatospora cineracea TaxID=88074 RepID=UPI0033D63D03